jgi:hypothetical protein
MSRGRVVHKILFDNSGSMSELGKEQLLINTLRFSRQYIEFNNILEAVSYHQLSETIDEIKLENNKDIVISIPSGRASGNVISEWFISHDNIHVLWITDGYTHFSEEQIFNLCKNSNIIIVALGCDADTGLLKRFKSKIFFVHNLEAALAQFFMPRSDISILAATVAESCTLDTFGIDESDDDEW